MITWTKNVVSAKVFFTMKALIIEDEFPSREELSFLLEKTGKIQIIGKFSCFEEALPLIQSGGADVIFLDIQINGINGIDAAKELIKMEVSPKIVFSTGYDEYAVQAFDLNAVDYITKPYSEKRILKTIDRLEKSIDNADKDDNPKTNTTFFEEDRISVWSGNRMVVLHFQDIHYFTSSENRKTILKTTDNSFEVKATLKQIETILDTNKFLRTHKSYIINLEKIKEIIPWFNSTYLVKFTGGNEESVPVSRHYIKSFRKAVGFLE